MKKSVLQTGYGPHFQPKSSSNLGSPFCFQTTAQDWTFHEAALSVLAWTHLQPFLSYNFITSLLLTWKNGNNLLCLRIRLSVLSCCHFPWRTGNEKMEVLEIQSVFHSERGSVSQSQLPLLCSPQTKPGKFGDLALSYMN